MATVVLFSFYVLTHLVVLYSAESCQESFCNQIIGNISFPYKRKDQPPDCGYYNVDCSNREKPKIQLKEGGYWFQLESMARSGSIFIDDESLQGRIGHLERDNCNDEVFNDLSLPKSTTVIHVSTKNLTLFRCNNTLHENPFGGPNYACRSSHHTYYTVSNDSLNCSAIQIPIHPDSPSNVYNPSALTANFSLLVQFTKECEECYKSHGKCFDDNGKFRCDRPCWNAKGEFNCTLAAQGSCRDKEEARKCKEDDHLSLKIGLGIGVPAVLLGVLVACLFLFRRYKIKFASSDELSRNISSQPYSKSDLEGGAYFGAAAGVVALVTLSCCFFWEKKRQDHLTVEAFLRNYGPLQVKRYSYSNVKKMTNSFKKKLGQGGYGGVYKGQLKDGRLVAVKVLNRSKGNGEEFMNEVAAISRTSHVNIVSLLGFCFERSKRALIYEFMPNGSLEKFIFDATSPRKDDHLGWEALERISLGIARGLEYLHRGCNTRILHFDIKPHNILLDENFLPKISDFGLAKICDRKESIVSMLCARGTAGYIAPEVFCRNFGGVSHKSDVYSYGMMLSEIVGGRRNINAEVENTSEIYFPHWIYNRLELNEELGLQSITSEEDKVRARKMIIVSLWCIQTDPSNRPAMKEVIEMLEGSVESLLIPPKPYLSSPPKSRADLNSSSTLVSLQ